MDLGGEFTTREAGRVKLVGVRLVVLLGGRVVHGESISLDGVTNGDACMAFN